MANIKSKSYTVKSKDGEWLAQIVLTTDGMFASVTDYGNFSFAWRSFGSIDFRRFVISLNVSYFAQKMFNGMSYVLHDQKTRKACQKMAEIVLPPFQQLLKDEIEQGVDW